MLILSPVQTEKRIVTFRVSRSGTRSIRRSSEVGAGQSRAGRSPKHGRRVNRPRGRVNRKKIQTETLPQKLIDALGNSMNAILPASVAAAL
jgi:hypothetical protein